MKYVLLVYQGTTPLPGSDRWKALSPTDQRQIYADYAELNQASGVTPGLPLGLPDPPFFGRKGFRHSFEAMAPGVWDDWVDRFYLQC